MWPDLNNGRDYVIIPCEKEMKEAMRKLYSTWLENPVIYSVNKKREAWQKGNVGESEMEAVTLFKKNKKKKLKAGAVLAVEVSDEETVKKMTKLVLECIHIMEKDRKNE